MLNSSVDDLLLQGLSGRRVLVTGHSGFKGGWLCLWLESLGAEVVGISLPPPTDPSFYDLAGIGSVIDSRFADIRDAAALAEAAAGFDAELVFHMAAQPIVRLSYESPADTFATNVTGTANVLDLAREMPSLRAVVVITSDKCYDNVEWPWAYRETDRLGGSDPYSASKACTELVAECYRRSWFADPAGPQLATVRTGNVIGGGDWARDRLVPDIVRAVQAATPLLIRNPRSVRPWQHVLEPLSGYLLLAARLLSDDGAAYSGPWNFGPSGDEPVDVEQLARAVMSSSPLLDLPIRFAAEQDAPHEAVSLRLDSSKAHQKLGWRPRLSSRETLSLTADWYSAFLAGGSDMLAVSRDQLAAYCSLGTTTIEGKQAVCV
jgi:CDP-glucose 4,6-dehydratase